MGSEWARYDVWRVDCKYEKRAFDENFDWLVDVMFIRVVATDHSGKARHSESGDVVTGSDDSCDSP